LENIDNGYVPPRLYRRYLLQKIPATTLLERESQPTGEEVQTRIRKNRLSAALQREGLDEPEEESESEEESLDLKRRRGN